MLSCMTFVFCSLLELAAVGYLSRENGSIPPKPPSKPLTLPLIEVIKRKSRRKKRLRNSGVVVEAAECVLDASVSGQSSGFIVRNMNPSNRFELNEQFSEHHHLSAPRRPPPLVPT